MSSLHSRPIGAAYAGLTSTSRRPSRKRVLLTRRPAPANGHSSYARRRSFLIEMINNFRPFDGHKQLAASPSDLSVLISFSSSSLLLLLQQAKRPGHGPRSSIRMWPGRENPAKDSTGESVGENCYESYLVFHSL
jgi:hypothetical protein